LRPAHLRGLRRSGVKRRAPERGLQPASTRISETISGNRFHRPFQSVGRASLPPAGRNRRGTQMNTDFIAAKERKGHKNI